MMLLFLFFFSFIFLSTSPLFNYEYHCFSLHCISRVVMRFVFISFCFAMLLLLQWRDAVFDIAIVVGFLLATAPRNFIYLYGSSGVAYNRWLWPSALESDHSRVPTAMAFHVPSKTSSRFHPSIRGPTKNNAFTFLATDDDE